MSVEYCQTCWHPKEMHMQVCGDRHCDCLCFIPPEKDTWQETAIMAVFELIWQQKEGTVTVNNCTIEVKFNPAVGYTVTKINQ